jgi:hypothetical protein
MAIRAEGAAVNLGGRTTAVKKHVTLPYGESEYTKRFRFDSYDSPRRSKTCNFQARAARLIVDKRPMLVIPGTSPEAWRVSIETADALAVPHAEAVQAVRAADVKNVDETSWKLAGQLCWLWVAATGTVAGFLIHPRRGGDALVAAAGREGEVVSMQRSLECLRPADAALPPGLLGPHRRNFTGTATLPEP